MEEEGAGWQEPPASLCSGAVRAAVRRELESRGLRAQPLPGAQLPAGKVYTTYLKGSSHKSSRIAGLSRRGVWLVIGYLRVFHTSTPELFTSLSPSLPPVPSLPLPAAPSLADQQQQLFRSASRSSTATAAARVAGWVWSGGVATSCVCRVYACSERKHAVPGNLQEGGVCCQATHYEGTTYMYTHQAFQITIQALQ